MPAKNKPNEIYISRVYDAPVKLVWDAWTDPKKTALWWGPRGFTLTTHSKDLRAGGHWKYTMHGPDGTDWPNTTIYHEVEKHSRLVYDHGGSEDRPPLFRVTVTFEEKKGKTYMEMTMALATPEAAAEAKKFIKKAGGDSTWDRLAEFLADGEGKECFVINRSFDAPQSLVYRMWTDAEHISRWLPPTGFKMDYSKADVRVGGESRYAMTNGELTMFGRINYLELSPPDRVVYTQQFLDKDGAISRHPMVPTFPETMRTTVTFREEAPGRTLVTVEWEPHGKATPEEIAMFRQMKPGMTMGWTGSFDKLEEVLAK